MSESVFIRLLTGGDIVIEGARWVHWTSRAGKALLALVCLNPTLAENRERLAALLWPESESNSARNNLRAALSSLRRDLQGVGADVIDADRSNVVLGVAPEQVDIWRFRNLIDSGDPSEVREGLELYQGDLLAGFGYISDEFEDIVRARREQYRDHAIESAVALLASIYQSADDDEFVVILRRLLAIDPANEGGYGLAIRRAFGAGNRPEALRLFNSYEDNVGRIYSIGPTDAMLRLRDDILADAQQNRPTAAQKAEEPKTERRIVEIINEPGRGGADNRLILAAIFVVAAVGFAAFWVLTNRQQSILAIVSVADIRMQDDRCVLPISKEDVLQLAVSELARIPGIAVLLVDAGSLDGTVYSLMLTAACVGTDFRLDAALADVSDGTHVLVGRYDGSAEEVRSILSELGGDLRRVLRPHSLRVRFQ